MSSQSQETRLRSAYALARQAMPHENVAIRATTLIELLETIDDLWGNIDNPSYFARLREMTSVVAQRVVWAIQSTTKVET